MAAPVRSASWLGAEHSSGRGGSEVRLPLPPHCHASCRGGEHLTRRLCVPGLASVHVRTSVGSENSVPEKVDHREIAVPVQMVDKVKLLLAPEPSEACEARSFGVVLLVKIYVRGE